MGKGGPGAMQQGYGSLIALHLIMKDATRLLSADEYGPTSHPLMTLDPATQSAGLVYSPKCIRAECMVHVGERSWLDLKLIGHPNCS